MSHFLHSFKAGNAGGSCARSGFMNGQYDLENRRCLMESTQGVLGIPKHPHLPEAKIVLPKNAASAAMVRLVDGKKRAQEIRSRDQLATPHPKTMFEATSTPNKS